MRLILAVSLAAIPCVAMAGDLDVDAFARRSQMRYTNVPRMVLAFYYPWYGNPAAEPGSGRWYHWENVDEAAKTIGTSTHYPSLGPYDSHDPAVIAQHCQWAKQSGVDGFIASWWGHGGFEDKAMPALLDACGATGLKATAYYEVVPDPPTPATAATDILRLLKQYAHHPSWLKVEGKPVLFIYSRAVDQLGLTGWLEVSAKLENSYPGSVVLIGDKVSRQAALVFDGLHTYATAGQLRRNDAAQIADWAGETYPKWVSTADRLGRVSTVTVMPGYDDTKIRKPGTLAKRLDGRSYEVQGKAALKANPDWVLITSWNEWHEGSEIEPSVEFGHTYLKLTAEFAKRFKASANRDRTVATSAVSPPTQADLATLRAKLAGMKIAALPGADSLAFWWLLELGVVPKQLAWPDVADGASLNKFDAVLYAGGEKYHRTVKTVGDVDAGLQAYLAGGGCLLVMPAGPMPLYYDEHGHVVDGARSLGLPLFIEPPGWEIPPPSTKLQFHKRIAGLPHTPPTIDFPNAGDTRWRPMVRDHLSDHMHLTPLLELRDASGGSRGLGAGRVEHRAGPMQGGSILYVWFGLLDQPHSEWLLYDLFDAVAQHARQPSDKQTDAR